MSFEQLRLNESLLRAVQKQGYTTPTEIQEKAIPHVVKGRDVLGCAQTGTGKTAAFALPILHRLTENDAEQGGAKKKGQHRPIRSLILSPTRELAAQIADSFNVYGRGNGLRHTCVYGGVNQNPQVKALRQGVDILIATPGRLLDLLNQRMLKLDKVEIFVLDEADRMLDMGFIPDIRKLVDMIPDERQTLLFSATMPKMIQQLADRLLLNPVEIKIKPEQTTAETVEQTVYFVEKTKKIDLLGDILQNTSTGQTLVFSRTKRGCDNIARKLKRFEVSVETIHSDKSQAARQRALRNFKSGKTHVLIGTDIAARGLDVDGISHVINYDMPGDAETYVHRIGRTGRAGMEGHAFSFCTRDELMELRSIERLLGKSIEVTSHDHEPSESFAALPLKSTGGGGGGKPRYGKQRRGKSGRSSGGKSYRPKQGAASSGEGGPGKRKKKQIRKGQSGPPKKGNAGGPGKKGSGKHNAAKNKAMSKHP